MKTLKIRTATKKGYDEVTSYDGVRLDHPGGSTGRGRTQKEKVGTLTCACDWGVIDKDCRIRKLVPIELERLQGFPDDWTKYDDKGNEIPETQRRKCIGNAVTTIVITDIMNNWELK